MKESSIPLAVLKSWAKMNNKTEELIKRWKQITIDVVKLKKFSKSSAVELVEDTQRHLWEFSESDVVPKEVLMLFLNMQNFFVETSMLSDDETPIEFHDCQELYNFMSALKKEVLI